MAYANARLTPFGRLVLVQPVLDTGLVGGAGGRSGGGFAHERLQIAAALSGSGRNRPP